MRLILAMMLAVSVGPAMAMEAATPQQFDSHVLSDPALGEIGWHLDNVNAEQKGPLVVWLPGSGAFPHFQQFSDGSQGTSFPRDLFAFRDRAHFLLVDKPGIPFSADMRLDPAKGRPVPLDGPAYRAGLSRDSLIARTVLAIAAARRALGDRVDQVVIIGGSEGAQYVFAVAGLAHADKAVGWGGLALPQYHDFIIEQRLRAERGEISFAQAQASVEGVFAAIKAIHADPLGLEQAFMGETNRRWSGFGTHAVVDDMLALEIPLLLVQGGDDDKAPIINTDFAMVTFLSRGRSNLDYWVYPEADHGMRVPDPLQPGKRVSIAPEIWARVWEWLSKESP
ncbi:alpha/beta hydrolase family protein [Stenotrophomonas maltophilia]|uniref:alpha/beta hydrolase family protein n=1 Tax=Stenotrophomonas maltophilia TaxID=40324 RepID=UPI0039176566